MYLSFLEVEQTLSDVFILLQLKDIIALNEIIKLVLKQYIVSNYAGK